MPSWGNTPAGRTEGALPAPPPGAHVRVVGVDIDVVQLRLRQGEDVDDVTLQDVAGLRKELVEAPALGLLHFQDVGQDGHQPALQPPAAPFPQQHMAPSEAGLRTCLP